jgi:hypothetical protein
MNNNCVHKQQYINMFILFPFLHSFPVVAH